jgi:hypothetical protein
MVLVGGKARESQPIQLIKAGKMLITGMTFKEGKLIELRVKNTPRFLINERCLS